MKWFRRGEAALPPSIAEALRLGPGDRVLAWGRDVVTGAYLVASLHALHHVPAGVAGASARPQAREAQDTLAMLPTGVAADGRARWHRPWHEVAAGAWEPGTATLSVTWSDGGRAAMWTLEGGHVRFPSVFHERVRASVYVSTPIEGGAQPVGQVALRRDLATGELLEQVTLRKGRRADDPALAEHIQRLLANLRDQAGL